MTDNPQPEALRLALSISLMDTFTNYQQEELGKAAAELRRQQDRIAELESELEAVGAGGVSGPLMGIAAPPTAQAEGWRLVPVEPTTDQEWAGKQAVLRGLTMAAVCKIYKAMLAAAPLPHQPRGVEP